MKKQILGGVFILSSMLCTASNPFKNNEGIVGFWQMFTIQTSQSGKAMVPTNAYKIYYPDNSFFIFYANTPPNGTTQVMGRGTFEETSDSTYTEKIIKHVSKTLNKSKTKLKYKMLQNKVMLVEYKLKGGKTQTSEIWKRVTMATPMQKTTTSISTTNQLFSDTELAKLNNPY